MSSSIKRPRHSLRDALAVAGLLTLTCFLLACSGSPTDGPDSDDQVPAPQTEEAAAPAGDTADEVAYEPAYPTDVSTEQLDESDSEQQTTAHSHGEGEHSHDEDGDHDHGDHDE